jgi:hypothetical protein
MIRKTKKGPRRLRHVTVIRNVTAVSTNKTDQYGITAGKMYRVENGDGFSSGWVTFDNGQDGFILYSGCAHLAGGDWNVEYIKERL